MSGVLETSAEVRRCLERSGDWYQPQTTSLLRIGGCPGAKASSEAFGEGFVEGMDERTELWRRLLCLEPRDREILFLWHVAGLTPAEVALRVGVSRRTCFRRRSAALEEVVRQGETPASCTR